MAATVYRLIASATGNSAPRSGHCARTAAASSVQPNTGPGHTRRSGSAAAVRTATINAGGQRQVNGVRRLAKGEARQGRRPCDDGASDVEGPGSQWPRSRVLGRLPEGHVRILAVRPVQGRLALLAEDAGPGVRIAPTRHVLSIPPDLTPVRPAGTRLWLRRSGTAAACQIRAASRTIAAANGSMNRMTMGPSNSSPRRLPSPTKNRTASQRGTLRLRHRAMAMSRGARYSLTK